MVPGLETVPPTFNCPYTVASELIVIVAPELFVKFSEIDIVAPGSTSTAPELIREAMVILSRILSVAPEATVTAKFEPNVPEPETTSAPLFTVVESE